MGTIVITWDFSPRVRGKGNLAIPIGISQRITSACAGKSLSDFPDIRPIRDHPRVCGEKYAV